MYPHSPRTGSLPPGLYLPLPESEIKGRSPVYLCVCPDPATVAFNYVLYDGQSDAGPFEPRAIAMQRMRNALDEILVEGIQTNIDLHKEVIMRDSGFNKGAVDIHYLEKILGMH